MMPQLPGVSAPVPKAAWVLAVAADLLQWALLPLFAGGALSGINVALDLVVAVVLTRLLGWHLVLLPAFAAELLPGVDLVPSWTAAVWFVARSRRAPPPGG